MRTEFVVQNTEYIRFGYWCRLGPRFCPVPAFYNSSLRGHLADLNAVTLWIYLDVNNAMTHGRPMSVCYTVEIKRIASMTINQRMSL